MERETDKTSKEEKAVEIRLQQLDEILRCIDALPVIDDRTPDAIVGYDENGLPL